MLSRKNESTYSELGPSLLENLRDLLKKIHKHEFDLYGFIYPSEFLLITSCKKDDARITLKVSLDSNDYAKFWDEAIDFIGLFWNKAFNGEDDLYIDWTKENNIYYQVTREDVELTLAADDLLKN